jgi:hypothetical protein
VGGIRYPGVTAIPAICKTCGEVFVTEAFVHADPGITFEMRGNTVGPCPRCGGAGRVPDGRYESLEGAVRYLADPTMTIGDLEKLRDIFERAQEENTSAAEVADAITKEVPRAAGLGALLQDGATPLATWIAVILAALTLLMQMRSQQPALTPDQVDNIVHRIIEETREAPEPTEPRPRRQDHLRPH